MVRFQLGILFAILVLIPVVWAQGSTNDLGNEYVNAVEQIFDSQGNLIDIGKYDDSFTQMSSNFQQLPGATKAILNNQRVQVDMEFTPSQSRTFGIVVQDEKIKSFTLGNLPDATLFLALDLQTLRDLQSSPGGIQEGLGKAMKDGRIKVRTTDFIQGIVVWFYLFTI